MKKAVGSKVRKVAAPSPRKYTGILFSTSGCSKYPLAATGKLPGLITALPRMEKRVEPILSEKLMIPIAIPLFRLPHSIHTTEGGLAVISQSELVIWVTWLMISQSGARQFPWPYLTYNGGLDDGAEEGEG